ncbi:MAG: hypothetical protein JWQ90_4551, partial [Hydrocarboniphaga sp.]|uniref:hypothetical protein n=1 Tax=Hydrocarboniphaga sp. TaxID=2033016 RepID=UPI0026210A1A
RPVSALGIAHATANHPPFCPAWIGLADFSPPDLRGFEPPFTLAGLYKKHFTDARFLAKNLDAHVGYE